MSGSGRMPPPSTTRLSVRCRLSRPTFLAGQTIHGLVVLTSYVEQPPDILTVRLHGYARVDARWLPDSTLSRPPPPLQSSSRSLLGAFLRPSGGIEGAKGGVDGILPAYPDLQHDGLACILTTPSFRLTRRARTLTPAQQITYRFSIPLPERMIPSYSRGTGAKYFYLVTLSVGGDRHQHIPITVLSEGYLGAPSMPPSNYVAIGLGEGDEVHSRMVGVDDAETIYGEGGAGFCWKRFAAKYLRSESEEVIPHHYDSGDEVDGDDDGGHDMYMAGLATDRRRQQRVHATMYTIRNGTAHLGKFVTYAKDYQPGAPLDGAFDFTGADLRCFRVSGCLAREELSYHSSPPKRRLISKAVVDAFHELTPDCASAAVFLKIPVDASPSFETPFTVLEYKIHFEFLTSASAKDDAATETEASDGEKEGQEEGSPTRGRPKQVTAADTAILRWVFPVRVVPPRDVDVTDLFLDHDVPRCSAEVHI